MFIKTFQRPSRPSVYNLFFKDTISWRKLIFEIQSQHKHQCGFYVSGRACESKSASEWAAVKVTLCFTLLPQRVQASAKSVYTSQNQFTQAEPERGLTQDGQAWGQHSDNFTDFLTLLSEGVSVPSMEQQVNVCNSGSPKMPLTQLKPRFLLLFITVRTEITEWFFCFKFQPWISILLDFKKSCPESLHCWTCNHTVRDGKVLRRKFSAEKWAGL